VSDAAAEAGERVSTPLDRPCCSRDSASLSEQMSDGQVMNEIAVAESTVLQRNKEVDNNDKRR